MRVDLVVKNIGQLVTMAGPPRPRTRKDIMEFSVIESGALVISGGRITGVGKERILKDFEIQDDTPIIDARGQCVTPGLVDAHTHAVFCGWREKELALKLKGYSYMDILQEGGGILNTVEKTRRATEDELIMQGKKSLNRMLAHGTTTIEAKSGYGLNLEGELKSLRVLKELDRTHPVDIIPTFLGAHVVPEEYKGNKQDFVDLVINEMIPEVAAQGLAEFCDVFCEEGVFTIEESRDILLAGRTYGLRPKLHADELVPFGGAELAAEVEAATADHLLCSSDAGIKAMVARGVMGVLLPGTSFSLMLPHFAPAVKMLEMGLPLALATDFNPGSSPTESLQIIMNLASLKLKMTPEEVMTAVTINGAYAAGRGDSAGSFEQGKLGDVVIWDAPNIEFLMYHYGVNLVDKVIKKGVVVVDGGRVLYETC
ncbi:imidazolonepropionase [Dehalococcoidia bacterium]|nr:imidazolonepropionase [Dehalococcoidia bacterium]